MRSNKKYSRTFFKRGVNTRPKYCRDVNREMAAVAAGGNPDGGYIRVGQQRVVLVASNRPPGIAVRTCTLLNCGAVRIKHGALSRTYRCFLLSAKERREAPGPLPAPPLRASRAEPRRRKVCEAVATGQHPHSRPAVHAKPPPGKRARSASLGLAGAETTAITGRTVRHAAL